MTCRSRPIRTRGLTLVELLLALAITGIIGAAVAAMLFAVARGTASRNDQRALLARQKAVEARLTAAARSSKRVLAVGSNYVVFWMADSRQDDQVNLSELRRIEWNSATARLSSYTAPFAGSADDQYKSADTAYALSSDFNQITAALKGQATFPEERWADGVTSFSFSLNHAEPQKATLVSYRGVLTVEAQSINILGAAALRVR